MTHRSITDFIFFTFVCIIITPLTSGQTISDNLLQNPGAENGTNEWTALVNRIETSSNAHTGTKSFNHRGLNGGGDGYLVVEQRVNVTTFTTAIDSGQADAVVGMWANTTNDFAGIILEFYDSIGIAIGDWKNETLSSPNGWKEFKYRIPIPANTRTIAFQFTGATETRTSGVGNNLNIDFDDLSLQILSNEPPTPTPTVTPIPTPIQPTPQPVTPDVLYTFDNPTLAENDLIEFPPGRAGEYSLADYFFRPLTTQTNDNAYTNGFGLSLVVEPGTGATFYGKPLTVSGEYVFLRVSAWASNQNVSIAIGALDATESDTVANANLNGSIGVNILFDAIRFVERFDHLEALYFPERNAAVPVFQVSNTSTDERVTVQFDNLEIYRIPKNQFPLKE
jgi:hypothetical protein